MRHVTSPCAHMYAYVFDQPYVHVQPCKYNQPCVHTHTHFLHPADLFPREGDPKNT